MRKKNGPWARYLTTVGPGARNNTESTGRATHPTKTLGNRWPTSPMLMRKSKSSSKPILKHSRKHGKQGQNFEEKGKNRISTTLFLSRTFFPDHGFFESFNEVTSAG